MRKGETSGFRLVIVGVVSASLFFALFGRALYLQVMQNQSFASEAAANQIRLIYTPAPRGRILDRNGSILVDNETVQAITVQRRVVKDEPEVLSKLAALLQLPVGDLQKRVNDQRFSDYRPVPVAEGVPKNTVLYLREHQDEFPGVRATQLAKRHYPNGVMAAHLLGYVGEINDAELKKHTQDGYRLGDEIGKTGIEKAYETYLRGTPGITKLEVNSSGRILRVLDETPPVSGTDLRLTIDNDAQRVAEDSLAQALGKVKGSYDKSSGRHFGAPAGSAVVIDPNDGSVVALASYPTYDPAQFINGISKQTFAEMQDPKNHYPLNNRAIQGLYAPGSTFKMITATASLQQGLTTPQTTLVDNGKIQIGNREFKNASEKALGPVDLVHALAYSSDVYFYKIGADFWYGKSKFGEAIQDEAKRFGFGKKTGIDIAGELSGRVPTPESRKRDHERNPKAFPEGNWYAGDNVNLAIGQGETVVTPLQLANAYATFANGGTIYQPHLGDRTVDENGKTIKQFDATKAGSVEITPANRDAILQGLHGATTFAGGTATQAFAGFDHNGFPVAGKTGTAQVFGKQDTALFVGMGPTTGPKYVVAVVLEEAGFGGVASAPIARRMFDLFASGQVSDIRLGGSAD